MGGEGIARLLHNDLCRSPLDKHRHHCSVVGIVMFTGLAMLFSPDTLDSEHYLYQPLDHTERHRT